MGLADDAPGPARRSKNPAYLDGERTRDQEATEDMRLLKKGVVLVHKGDEVRPSPLSPSPPPLHSSRVLAVSQCVSLSLAALLDTTRRAI